MRPHLHSIRGAYIPVENTPDNPSFPRRDSFPKAAAYSGILPDQCLEFLDTVLIHTYRMVGTSAFVAKAMSAAKCEDRLRSTFQTAYSETALTEHWYTRCWMRQNENLSRDPVDVARIRFPKVAAVSQKKVS